MTKRAKFQHIVKDNWFSEDEDDMFIRMKQKMKKKKVALSIWSKVVFGDIFKQIAILGGGEKIVRVKQVLFEASHTTDNRKVLQKPNRI